MGSYTRGNQKVAQMSILGLLFSVVFGARYFVFLCHGLGVCGWPQHAERYKTFGLLGVRVGLCVPGYKTLGLLGARVRDFGASALDTFILDI